MRMRFAEPRLIIIRRRGSTGIVSTAPTESGKGKMSIPTLDMQIAESDRGWAAKQLVAALEEPGFLYLKNVRGYQPGECPPPPPRPPRTRPDPWHLSAQLYLQFQAFTVVRVFIMRGRKQWQCNLFSSV